MRKIHAVKDKTGKVIATFEKPSGDGPAVKPVLGAGHTVHEMEVAENYHQDLKAFYEHHAR